MYVMAAVPRCVEAVDVDTRQSVYMPLRVSMRPTSTSAAFISTQVHPSR